VFSRWINTTTGDDWITATKKWDIKSVCHSEVCAVNPPAIQYFKIVILRRIITLWDWVRKDSSSTN